MTIYCINICKHLKNIQKALSGKPYLCPSVASRNNNNINNYDKSKTVSLQIALVSQCSGEIIFYDIVDGEPKPRFHEIISKLDESFVSHYLCGNSGAPVSHFFSLYICNFLFFYSCVHVCVCMFV